MNKNCISPFLALGKKCRQIFLLFFLISFSSHLLAQKIHVDGTVKDTKGTALSGVSITVKGTSTGTTTDATGNFAINVPSKSSVLVFSDVGFLSKEVTVGN